MSVGIVIPTRAGDEWRARALEWVLAFYAREFPGVPIELGEIPDDDEWSKGAAIAAGAAELDATTIILADADSFVSNVDELRRAVDLVESGRRRWVVPHRLVYRLREAETERLYNDPTNRARTRSVCRTPYVGPAGGGITVVSAETLADVPVDRRFLGWGGEDVAFGWALETLVHPVERLAGRFVHLWHPHPAPNLRGSAESEELVARYREARGFPRRMRAVVDGDEWEPLPPLPRPVRFVMKANRRTLRLFGSDVVLKFPRGEYETDDPELVEALRRHQFVTEDRSR